MTPIKPTSDPMPEFKDVKKRLLKKKGVKEEYEKLTAYEASVNWNAVMDKLWKRGVLRGILLGFLLGILTIALIQYLILPRIADTVAQACFLAALRGI